ncbi:MAG: hypothetical protein EBR82_64560 [Caulobacteraceae bacterium]|nr:hypothetical protein [Caulobacteraceae bacterium]
MVDVCTAHPAPKEYGAVAKIVKQVLDVVLLAVATAIRQARSAVWRRQFLSDQYLPALEQAQVIDRPDGNLAGEKLDALLVA